MRRRASDPRTRFNTAQLKGGRVRSKADVPAIIGPDLPVGQTRPPGIGVLVGAFGTRRPRRQRNGYTLLELLIAAVLIATLMAAVWNLMTMYSGFLAAGRSQATEQQLARSLLDLLAADIGSIVPQQAELPSGSHPAGGPITDSSLIEQDTHNDFATGLRFADTTELQVRRTGGLRRPSRGPLYSWGSLDGPARSIRPFSTSLSSFPSVSEQEGTKDSRVHRPDFHLHPGRVRNSETTGGEAERDGRLPEFAIRGTGRSLTLIVTQRTPDLRDMRRDVNSESPSADESADGFAASAALTGDLHSLATQRAEEWQQIVYHFVPPRAVRADERDLAPGLHRFAIPVESLGLLAELQTVEDRGSPTRGGFAEDDFPAEPVESIAALQELGVALVDHEWIPEVVRCRFTYRTDAGWSHFSQTRGNDERPVAVRIQFELLSSREHEQLMAALGSTDADDPITSQEPSVEVTTAVGIQSDPFAAFRPRSYERMIVLHPRPVRAPPDPYFGSADSPSLDAIESNLGGQP